SQSGHRPLPAEGNERLEKWWSNRLARYRYPNNGKCGAMLQRKRVGYTSKRLLRSRDGEFRERFEAHNRLVEDGCRNLGRNPLLAHLLRIALEMVSIKKVDHLWHLREKLHPLLH